MSQILLQFKLIAPEQYWSGMENMAISSWDRLQRQTQRILSWICHELFISRIPAFFQKRDLFNFNLYEDYKELGKCGLFFEGF